MWYNINERFVVCLIIICAIVWKFCMEMFKEAWHKFLNETKYKFNPYPMPIDHLIDKWKNESKKEEFFAYYSPGELWKYREYTWTETFSRGWSSETWDKIKKSLKERGYNESYPILLIIGKNGKAKVGEGNHRLAITKQMGFKKIPVKIIYYQNVSVDIEMKYNTEKELRKADAEWKEGKRLEKIRKEKENAEWKSKLAAETPEEKKQLDTEVEDLIKLFGF